MAGKNFKHLVHSMDHAGTAAMKTRLACIFTAGPTTETNVEILLGPLDLRSVPLAAEDAPQNRLPMTSLLPPILESPKLQLRFQASAPSDQGDVYPTGLAVCSQAGLVAIVDRENAAVKIFQLSTGKLIKVITGTDSTNKRCNDRQHPKLIKPFDVVFMDQTGSTLSVSDPAAGAVRTFETITGRYIFSFSGLLPHPRGLVMMKTDNWNNRKPKRSTPKDMHIDASQQNVVVVVDGHLRHLTFHKPATGEMLRRLIPTNGNSADAEDNGFMETSASTIRHKDNSVGDDDVQREKDNCLQKENHNPTKLLDSEQPLNRSTALIDPYYVAVTLCGNLVVTDLASPNLKIVSKHTGMVLSTSMDYGTREGEALHPSGLCVDKHGRIFVSDTNNNRVHFALPNGQLTGSVLLPPEERSRHHTSRADNTIPSDTSTSRDNEPSILHKTGTSPLEIDDTKYENNLPLTDPAAKVSKPLSVDIDDESGQIVVAQVGGEVKVVKYIK